MSDQGHFHPVEILMNPFAMIAFAIPGWFICASASWASGMLPAWSWYLSGACTLAIAVLLSTASLLDTDDEGEPEDGAVL